MLLLSPEKVVHKKFDSPDGGEENRRNKAKKEKIKDKPNR